MRFPEIQVTLIAKTIPDSQAIQTWVRSIDGCENYVLDTEATAAEQVILHAAKNCYKSFVAGANPNVTKIREDLYEYFDNILKSGHGSVLEAATFTFAIENLTRVATGELNRHRAGTAISERSMRYCRFTDLPFWLPTWIKEPSQDKEFEKKRLVTLDIIFGVLEKIEHAYAELVRIWDLDNSKNNFHYKKLMTSFLRRILPMGTCTSGVWTFNVRALRHILELRSSPAAEEEIAYIFGIIGKIMHDSEPRLFGDFELKDGFWVPKYHKV